MGGSKMQTSQQKRQAAMGLTQVWEKNDSNGKGKCNSYSDSDSDSDSKQAHAHFYSRVTVTATHCTRVTKQHVARWKE